MLRCSTIRPLRYLFSERMTTTATCTGSLRQPRYVSLSLHTPAPSAAAFSSIVPAWPLFQLWSTFPGRGQLVTSLPSAPSASSSRAIVLSSTRACVPPLPTAGTGTETWKGTEIPNHVQQQQQRNQSFSTSTNNSSDDEDDDVDGDGDEEEDERVKIRETDLEEQFIRGSGPGGQKINKSSVCVMLKHIPTGIVVRCQESRSQTRNREIARKILKGKLDDMVRGEESEAAREASRARARKAKRRRKSIKKHFKSRRDRLLLD